MTASRLLIFTDSIGLSTFESTLPTRYRAIFQASERAIHERICLERKAGDVNVGLFPSRKLGQTAICLCAEDEPGLLSLASAALSMLGFEVQEAVAYRRNTPSSLPDEVLDVFWLKDPSKLIMSADIAAFANLLSEYLAGRPPEGPRQPGSTSSGPSGTSVRFVENRSGTLSILEVETSDRFGLLWDISRTLTACGLHIVSSEIRTLGGRVTDAFTVEETSRAPISPARRLEIQSAVLSTLEM